jgi:hypothetical protein
MKFTPKEYMDIESDQLPYETKWGDRIDRIEGQCSDCKKKLTNMKVMINEYPDFVFVRSAGICYNCKLVVSIYPFKITNEGVYMILKDGQWLVTEKPSWYSRIKNFFMGNKSTEVY